MIRKTLIYLTIILSACFLFSSKGFHDTISYTFFHVPIKSALAQEIPLVVWPHEKSDLVPDPSVEFGRFSNGFRYVIMENNEPKDRVSLHLIVQVGSMHESDKERGLAHFLEHMLFNGSTHFAPGELVKYFQKIGMQFGPDANAHTGFFETVYDIILPDGSKESLENALLVMQDYAEGALLLQSEIDRERNVVLAEKRTRDSASYRTFEATFNFELPNTRISKRLPIGLEEVLKTANKNLFKDFYDAWYRPENLTLVIVGDCNKKTAEKLITERFSKLSSRTKARTIPSFGEIYHEGVKTFHHYEKEAGNTSVNLELVEKVPAEPDSLSYQKQMLIKHIGNMIVQNRLNTMVQKPDTPFTKASISSGIFLRQINYADLSADCSPENWEKTLGLIEKTLRTALEFGFTQSELERVKKDYHSSLDRAVKGMATRKSQNLARQIIRHINNDRVFQSPVQEKNIYAPIINALTLEKVYDAFKETWSQPSRLILVTGNVEIGPNPEKKILSVFETSRKVEVAKPAEKISVPFPYLPEPDTKGNIVDKKEIPDLGIMLIDFQNRFRLNLKKTDFKANEVLFTLGFGKGKFTEPNDKDGLAAVSTAVINGSGLGKLTKDELEQALAGKNTYAAFGVDEQRFVLKGRSVTDEIPLLFQLLYAYIKDMGFQEDAFTLAMERFDQKYMSMSHTIEGAMELKGKRFLAGGDTRFGLPDHDTLKQNTLSDIRSWVTFFLKNSDLELSIVGDFDSEQVIETAARYLGTLPSPLGNTLPKDTRAPKFPDKQSLEIKVPTKIPKGIIDVAYPTEDFWDIKRTRRLVMLGEIFSERLRINIREKLGASYSFYAYNRSFRAYKGFGVFHAVVQVDPAQTDIVLNNIYQIASDICQKGITQDDLQRALDPVLTGLKDMRRTNGYWLNSVLTGSKEYPVQLDWCRTIMDDYASITVKDLVDLANTYLDNKKAATIIIYPEK